MARARNIKPGFFKNEDLAECSFPARLCFAGLWTLADREGRLEDRPKRIKGELFAFDSIEVDPLLAELQARGFIERYRNSDGSFIQISKFSSHQTPHYSEKASVIKPPGLQESDGDDADKKPGALQDGSKKDGSLRGGRNPLNPDSPNPDSPNPDSPNPDSPNPEEDSDADASAAAPPPATAEPKPLTAKDRAWLLGPALLGNTPSARSFLGKLAKTYGDEVLAAVLAEATAEQPLEPKAWVTAACDARSKASPRVNGAQEPLDLLADPKPEWAIRAGFPDRFQAENAGCRAGNASQFRDGKRQGMERA